MSNIPQSGNTDWWIDIDQPTGDKLPQLKLADKEIVKATFKNEGVKNHHSEFGDSVVFDVVKDGETETKKWFVNAKNFDLLRQIKALRPVTGLKVEIRRSGSTKGNTRYFIQRVPLF